MGSQYDQQQKRLDTPDPETNGICKMAADVEESENESNEKQAMNGTVVNQSEIDKEKEAGENGEIKKVPPKVKLRIAKTICLYLTFMAVGLATNLLGPTLTNMRVYLATNTKTIVTAFSGSILGWIGGSVVAGVLYERFNPEIQLSLSVLVMALTTGIAPWVDNVAFFIAVMTTQGLGAGYIDAAGQPYGLSLWEGHPYKDPVMQATQLFLSIGCTAAPLLVSPFLTEIKALELPHGNLSELQHNSSALGVLEGTVLDVPKFKHYKVISVENSSIPAKKKKVPTATLR